MFNYKLDTGDLTKLVSSTGASQAVVNAEILKAITRSAVLIQNYARGQSPVRTGKLRNSIGFKIKGFTAIIAPNVKYANFVEGGTGIYGPANRAITPTNKKVLATKINPGWGTANKGGYFIIGKSSKGQKANPFMERTFLATPPIVTANFMLARDNIILKTFA